MIDQPLWRLVEKSKREELFVHSQNPKYSLSVRHPVDLIPKIITTSFYHTVTLYENGKTIETKEIPENLLDYVMMTIGRRVGE